jgi:Nucleotidyl transferase AbiEii toxin, Type IV TA system
MNDIIKARLAAYSPSFEVEQEIALFALWRAKFFAVAVFQGGTSLRIRHKLPRSTDDLDFMLLQPEPEFDWGPYPTRPSRRPPTSRVVATDRRSA